MKRHFFLLLFLALSVACNSANQSSQKVMTEPETVARAVFQAFNAHRWEVMENFYADDVIFTDPVLPGPKRGKEGMSDWYKTVPDIYDDIQAIHVSGNVVVVQFVSTGTESGRKFKKAICSVLTIKDGKVVKDETYYDL